MQAVARVSVSSFGGPDSVQVEHGTIASPAKRTVRVRVTHASVGSTDALAREGRYLLQPRAGFTPGYDFVGVIDSDSPASGWERGTRVAGCLPRMGSNSTLIDVKPSLLVAVPEALPSAEAAALPLDLVTAGLAVALADPVPRPSVLVQGVSGALGALIAQHFASRGAAVLGTASARSRTFAESLGAHVLDYRDPHWRELAQVQQPDGVGAVFDHTGDPRLRQLASADGTVVRLAFVGRPGRERLDTVAGGAGAMAQYFRHPRTRVCSVPLFVATQPRRYRELLRTQFDRIVSGELRAPSVRVVPLSDVSRAHRELAEISPGQKIVLTLA
ncbi:zinc-binding dehydrogenase [Salinibacterium sp. ZJ450]|uniref:zinc-binding dehydrogenase n=1 Tax=Salinibacterium sp. ZJ450 TaxID=2708338 RepID=UPI0014206967|nr:zinc-binding dehydrogenase [Salinibacterium sp. ZJ450]